MKQSPGTRHMRYVVISIFVVGILYVAACIHVLSRLSETSLITNYISFPYSKTSPVFPFPVAGWLTDLHWKIFASQRVFQANQGTNDYVKYISERIALAEQLSESLDMERSRRLLSDLVCAKRNNDQAMQDIKEFQRKWSSQLLGAAIQRCESSLSLSAEARSPT